MKQPGGVAWQSCKLAVKARPHVQERAMTRRSFISSSCRLSFTPLHLHLHACYRLTSYPSLTFYLYLSSPSFLRCDRMARTDGAAAQPQISSLQSPTPRPRPRAHVSSPPPSRRQSLHTLGPTARLHVQWLFRSNIPHRRGMPLPVDVHKRNFFGIGEILSVLANVSPPPARLVSMRLSRPHTQPSETLRSLTESRRMLEETRRELAEARERAQLSPTHTFSGLPGFFDRPAELKAIERALEGEPSFTVVFGASSVGKVNLCGSSRSIVAWAPLTTC